MGRRVPGSVFCNNLRQLCSPSAGELAGSAPSHDPPSNRIE